MIATPKCKIPLDICLENPEWLPLVGCSGEGLPLQVCLDFPKLITSPACEGQNCTFQACQTFLLLFPFFSSSSPHTDDQSSNSSPQCSRSLFSGDLSPIPFPSSQACMPRSVVVVRFGETCLQPPHPLPPSFQF